MFGGVGLPSAKGTGTNGYVERALGYLPKDYKPGSYGEIIRQMKANPAPIKRKINDDIILHEEKHKIEVELYNLKEKYENEKKYTEDEINDKINNERKRLYHLLERREADFMDKNETHQKGKLKDAQMKIIRDALKIKEGYY
jgi:serine/arginine repetitive matrix protein 2